MSEIERDETPSTQERAEAERLAHALERGTADADVETLAVARFLAASVEVVGGNEVAAARLRRDLVSDVARLRAARRLRALVAAAAVVILIAATALIVRGPGTPPSTALLQAREDAARTALAAVKHATYLQPTLSRGTVAAIERAHDDELVAALVLERFDRLQDSLYYANTGEVSRPRGATPRATATTGGRSS